MNKIIFKWFRKQVRNYMLTIIPLAIEENKRHAIDNGLVNEELRKSNMSKLGKSKKALMKRWGTKEQYQNNVYTVKE